MILESITVANFRTFTGEQTFTFPTEPGLYFMQGRNEAEPRLGSNGAGKSTLWDALMWCLFGKTSRGLKAGDVCNWGAGKGTRVTLVFNDLDTDSMGGIEHRVTRTWGPISWKLRSRDISGARGDFDDEIDLAKDPSNPVLALLRLDFLPFLNCVLTAQSQPMFLDQDPKAQAELFSGVMGLDCWLGYASVASAKASAQDSISRVLERKLATLRGQLETIGQSDLGSSVQDWENDRKARLDRLEIDYEAALARAKAAKAPMAELQELERNQRALVLKTQSPAEALARRIKEVDRELRDCLVVAAGDDRELEALHNHARFLETHDHCPTCDQELPKDSHAAQIKKAQRVLGVLQLKSSSQAQRIAKLKQEMKTLEAEEDAQRRELLEQQECLSAVLDSLSQARREVANLDRELDRIEEQAETISNEKNPYADMHEQFLRDGKQLHADARATQRLLDDSNSKYSLLSYWVRGFKELRLQLIAEALNELEIEVNSCVASLGLVDWELNFQVDRETKGGGIQRGFSVLVKSPHNKRAVPWEAWSGGEAQRLRLAGNMGLADLIRSRSGATLNLEVWDEPTQHLNPGGIQDLLRSLAARAQQENRPIWLVDHHAHNFGGFSGGATIVKTKTGSKIEPV